MDKRPCNFPQQATLIIFSFIFSLTAIQVRAATPSNVPALPGCECSQGTEVPYSEAASMGKVFIASCSCPYQRCAVSWNKAIAMECTASEQTDLPNASCADFTKMQVGYYGVKARIGNFEVLQLPNSFDSGKEVQLRITFEEVPGGAAPTPNGLATSTDQGVEFKYPVPYKTARIDWTFFVGASVVIDIVTTANIIVRKQFPFTPPQGSTFRVEVSHPDGIKKLSIRGNPEMQLYEVCARDIHKAP